MSGQGVILHPTDYSAHANQALDLACRIARSRGDRLLVMHVAEPVRGSSLGMAPVPPLPRGYRGAWESRLRLVRPYDTQVPVEHRLEEGDVASAIVRVAREMPCDLIVMSGRQRTWLRGRWYGSIPDEVEREASCPVVRLHTPRQRDVTASANGDHQHKVVLHPTDFSQSARLGFELARVLAAESGSELILAHVAPASVLSGKGGIRDEIEASLHRMAESDPSARVSWRLLAGEPASEILRLAREYDCNSIVMGTTDRDGLERLFGRRTTAQVRWNAPCPVVTVKLPPGWSVDQPKRGRKHETSNNDQFQRQGQPGAVGSHRATCAAPAERALT